MIFEPKISGTRVTDFEIIIPTWLRSPILTLKDFYEHIERQKTMDYILDTFRFSKGANHKWYATFDNDTLLKITVLEWYPEYEKEFINYFGEKWYNHYIRFNH